MGTSYTPTYYSSLHDTITSLCKSILPFRRLRLSHPHHKRQSENLKWQQDSFHRILHLIALHREGIVPESDVSSFRTHLLDTLIAAPRDAEPPGLLRDKLLFLQELLYAKCISPAEYHSSKRPLLQRLAVQGVEIDSRDLVISGGELNGAEDEKWSVIDLRDKEITPPSKKETHRHPLKPLRNAMALFGNKQKNEPKMIDPPRNSCTVLMAESVKESSATKKKSIHDMFCKEQGNGSGKKQWGFEGLMRWKRGGGTCKEEAVMPFNDRSDDVVVCELVANPVSEGPDTKRIKTKIHSDGSNSDFFIDKVLGDNIKKELTRIQTELGNTNTSLAFTEEQKEAISMRLPVEKGDLKEFFPKYGDVVLDVVLKEFKDHVGEMEERHAAAMERRGSSSQRWVAFGNDDVENHHPNLFSAAQNCEYNPFSGAQKKNPFASKNPFLDDDDHQNPFYTPQQETCVEEGKGVEIRSVAVVGVVF